MNTMDLVIMEAILEMAEATIILLNKIIFRF
jgi:hypothetical protein